MRPLFIADALILDMFVISVVLLGTSFVLHDMSAELAIWTELALFTCDVRTNYVLRRTKEIANMFNMKKMSDVIFELSKINITFRIT